MIDLVYNQFLNYQIYPKQNNIHFVVENFFSNILAFKN